MKKLPLELEKLQELCKDLAYEDSIAIDYKLFIRYGGDRLNFIKNLKEKVFIDGDNNISYHNFRFCNDYYTVNYPLQDLQKILKIRLKFRNFE